MSTIFLCKAANRLTQDLTLLSPRKNMDAKDIIYISESLDALIKSIINAKKIADTHKESLKRLNLKINSITKETKIKKDIFDRNELILHVILRLRLSALQLERLIIKINDDYYADVHIAMTAIIKKLSKESPKMLFSNSILFNKIKTAQINALELQELHDSLKKSVSTCVDRFSEFA